MSSPVKSKLRSIFEWPKRNPITEEDGTQSIGNCSHSAEKNVELTSFTDIVQGKNIPDIQSRETNYLDLRKKVFKTKLSLDFGSISKRSSKSKILRKISEENDSIVVENGQVVRLRVSSTSSSRSYRGEVPNIRNGSTSSSSLGSPCYSIPSTPDSPTPDIDCVFAHKQRMAKDSPDTMADVKKMYKNFQFIPETNDNNEAMIRQRLLIAQSNIEKYSPRVVEDFETSDESICHDPSHETRKENLQRSIDWLREELLAMKQQDQDIARRLISIRLEIQRVRLQHSIVTHKAILENVTHDVEYEKEFTYNHCDLPEHLIAVTQTPVLHKNMGITKLNITSRRFSLR